MTSSKIMIVEDESIVALDIQARLSRLGYEVVGIADSGRAALDLAEAIPVDLALMDVRLKGNLDGIETAHRLRTQFHTPIIYLTAYADDTTLQRAQLTEPFGYLIKPFEERELQSTIEMALYKIKMEKRLLEQSARLQKIVATVPEGVALLDANYRIELANANAQDFFKILAGASNGDVVEHLGDYPIEHFLSPTSPEKWYEVPLSGISRHIFEVMARPVSTDFAAFAEGIQSSGWVMVIRDVTDEREIRQRTELQARMAAIGQLSAGIAHDFNNILSGIILGAQSIQRAGHELPAKVEERLGAISRQAQRASDLIRQILDFSRASSMEILPFDLLPLVKEVVKMLERTLPETVRIQVSYPSYSCTIKGDATRIQQLLVNLALNSRDAMPNGGILRLEMVRVPGIQLGLADVDSDEDWIRIRVIDNGSGIAPDVLPHIFEPFFTTKTPDKGTGLGLAQVYGIVKQHGGHVNVESQAGQGSAFTVYLPAMPQQTSLPNIPTAEDTLPAEGTQQTILIVEDNLDARQSIEEIIQLLNYRVLTASNGVEGLAALDAPDAHVDLILTDLIMPEMGGVDMIRELRRRKNDVKIIAMTGYASTETVTELKVLNVNICLDKPVDINRLSVSLTETLRK